jgi:EmrB/QacA subfamily drug resistance transporter
MATLDSYIVNVSLPSIARDFDVTMSKASLVILSYLLSLTSATLISGKLSDRFGLRSILVIGYALFMLASIFCAYSPGIDFLIAWRFIQGIGAAMIVTSGYAIVPRLVPSEIQGRAFGYVSILAALGPALGTPLGGIISGYSSWHWVFLINLPIGIAAMLVAWKTLPGKTEKNAVPERMDFPGAVLSFAGISALIFALNSAKEIGWTSPEAVLSFLVGVVALSLFVRVEKKALDPILNLDLFKNMAFVLALLASVTAMMVLSGNNFLLPFYLEINYGLKPQEVGFLLLIYSVIAIFVGPNAGRLSDKIRPVWLCGTAMLSAACACAAFALTLHYRSLLPSVVFLTWYGLSNAFFISPNNHQVLSFAPANEKGSASGIFNMFVRLSLVLGVCAFETLFTMVVPHGNGCLAGAGVEPAVLNRGFQTVYAGAALLCFASFLVSVVSARRAS